MRVRLPYLRPSFCQFANGPAIPFAEVPRKEARTTRYARRPPACPGCCKTDGASRLQGNRRVLGPAFGPRSSSSPTTGLCGSGDLSRRPFGHRECHSGRSFVKALTDGYRGRLNCVRCGPLAHAGVSQSFSALHEFRLGSLDGVGCLLESFCLFVCLQVHAELRKLRFLDPENGCVPEDVRRKNPEENYQRNQNEAHFERPFERLGERNIRVGDVPSVVNSKSGSICGGGLVWDVAAFLGWNIGVGILGANHRPVLKQAEGQP